MKKLLFPQRRLVHHRSMAKVVGVVVLCLFIFNSFFSSAQNPLVKMWDKRFGGTDYDFLISFQQTKDGGFILGGVSPSEIGGDKTQSSCGSWDYWLVKTDSLGNKQWDRDFGGTYNDNFKSLVQTSDGGYILGGASFSNIGCDKTQLNRDTTCASPDFWIVKTDSIGNKQWDKIFGGINIDGLSSLKQTSDGGYILGGNSFSGIGGDKTQNTWGSGDYWIVKIDSLGNKEWDKTYGGINGDALTSIQQTSDSGYILGGSSFSGISGDKTQGSQGGADYWIVKIDSLGNQEWDKDFGGSNDDYMRSISQTSNGGYVFGGYSLSNISGDKTQNTWGDWDFWIVKTDALGNKEWDKDLGGIAAEDDFGNLTQTSDGGYLIAGTSYSNISGDKTETNLSPEQTWVVKTDSLGNKQWDKTLRTNSTSHDEFGLAIESKDGCYLMANSTEGGIGGDKTQAGWGVTDYWIIKFCDSTHIGIDELTDENSFSISPNPTNGKFEIKNSELKIESIDIYNTLGEKVLTAAVNRQPFTVNCEQLPSGIYFMKAYTGDKVLYGKVVKK